MTITGDVAHADVGRLGEYVEERLQDLGLSKLAASKLGIVSRATLSGLTSGGRIPTNMTLAKLDELLSWENGSARAVLHGGEPTAREAKFDADGNLMVTTPVMVDTENLDFERLAEFMALRIHEAKIGRDEYRRRGGPARATVDLLMGRRGLTASLETLERIDRTLGWERGSALIVLHGGKPTLADSDLEVHPAVVQIQSIMDSLLAVKGRLARSVQSNAVMQASIDQALRRSAAVLDELGAFRGVEDDDDVAEDTDTLNGRDVAGQENTDG